MYEYCWALVIGLKYIERMIFKMLFHLDGDILGFFNVNFKCIVFLCLCESVILMISVRPSFCAESVNVQFNQSFEFNL